MLISYRHKFIFLHRPKTAGSAITVSLSRYLGPWDIQIGVHNDSMKLGILPRPAAILRLTTGAGLMKFTGALLKTGKVPHAFNEAVKKSYGEIFPNESGHAGAEQVKETYPKEWNEFFKFSVVRNPFDRMVSYYLWLMRTLQPPVPFADFVRAVLEEREISGLNVSYYDCWKMDTIDDALILDEIIKFENLASDLAAVMRRIGLDWDGWLPHTKVNPNKDNYQRYYTPKEVELVRSKYAREIKLFDYRF